MIQNWLMDGEILNLSDNWEYQDDALPEDILEQIASQTRPIDVEDIDIEDQGGQEMGSEVRRARDKDELEANYNDDSVVSKGTPGRQRDQEALTQLNYSGPG